MMADAHRWLPFPKAAAQMLEAAREQDQQVVRLKIKPQGTGWTCKFTGVQSTLEFVIDLPSMTQVELASGLKRAVRRRICAPVPIFNLLDIEGIDQGGPRTHAHEMICDCYHRPGFALIRVPEGSLPAPSEVYSLWKPFFHHTPRQEKERLAAKGPGAMSSLTGSGWVGTNRSTEHFEVCASDKHTPEAPVAPLLSCPLHHASPPAGPRPGGLV
eukprot:COSAG05_NODE_1510_length_4685_cov_3.769298_4_plen_214_part_00